MVSSSMAVEVVPLSMSNKVFAAIKSITYSEFTHLAYDLSSSSSSSSGKTYRLRISNVGLQDSLNFRIQNHKMKVVEVEGTHTLQTTFSSLDVHVGQSYSVLVTADQPAQDYYVVVSSRFTSNVLTTTGVLRYSNSAGGVSGPIPGGPTIQIDWSLNQARAIRYRLSDGDVAGLCLLWLV